MDVHSELTGMSGVLTNSEFAVRKLTFSRCHGRHLLNSGTDAAVEKRTSVYAFQQRKGLEGRAKRVPK